MSWLRREDAVQYLSLAGRFLHQGSERQQGIDISWIEAESLLEEVQRHPFVAALNGFCG
jgi:hypothetical protein